MSGTPESRLLLIGSALSAQAAARLALANGWSVSLVDDRPLAPAIAESFTELGVTLLPSAESALSCNPSLIVPSPAVPMNHPVIQAAHRHQIPVRSEISFARSWVPAHLVGITGSNGKTTTTALCAALLQAGGLRAAAGGNIGVPLAELALADTPWDALALELSSYQLETTEDLAVDAAVLLNLSEDHLARHGSLEAYGDTKFRLAHQLAPEGVVIHGDEDVFFAPRVRAAGLTAWRFGTREDCEMQLDGQMIRFQLAGLADWLDTRELKLQGRHNAWNVMAATLAAWKLGVDARVLAEAARRFAPLAHRLEPVPSRHPARWINDSKATNADAGLQAVLSAPATGRLILLAGGEAKGPDFHDVARALTARGARAILFGRDRELILAGLQPGVPCDLCDTLDQAVALAASRTGAGDTVLFSPLCASFDQYRNYEHRGDHFRQLAGAL
ncbi:MAG: UDP-N-acetylmuramoyl-L-alanine--D-glutamate ligase [Candidatus Cloacimonetes bacterium]|nr:UDP-N-acetylmuramoyl-L-alanine--D-glutamate ligase [Candidatus Cloacimonadota bacterium]